MKETSQKLRFISFRLFLPLLAGLLLAACASEPPLPIAHAKEQIENHLHSERYRGILQLDEIEFVDNRLDRFQDNEYMDMLFHVRFRVKEDWVMSRIFMPYGFDINRELPLMMQANLDGAPDEETRESLMEFYRQRAFPAGEHKVKSLVTYGRLENRWVFVEMSMDGSLD